MILHIWPHIFQDIFLVVATIFFFLDAIKGQQSRGLFLEHNNMETRLQKSVEYTAASLEASIYGSIFLFCSFFSMDKMGVKKMNTIRWRQCQKSQTFLPNISKKKITHSFKFC